MWHFPPPKPAKTPAQIEPICHSVPPLGGCLLSGFAALRCVALRCTASCLLPRPRARTHRIPSHHSHSGLHLRGHSRVTHTTQCLWAGGAPATTANCQSVIYQRPLCAFGRLQQIWQSKARQSKAVSGASSAFMSWFCIMPCKYRALRLSYCVSRMAGTQLMKYGQRLFSRGRMAFPPFHSARASLSYPILPGTGWKNNIGIYFHGRLRALI